MAGGCKSAIGCVDARAPVRASYVSLYKWPESDAEFVKSVAMARRHQGQESPAAGGGSGAASASSYYYHHNHYYYNGGASKRSSGELGAAAAGHGGSPRVVDSYSCRQMYLRSYTFSKKKETVPERTMACLGRVRERAAVFPFLPQRGAAAGGGSAAASDAGSVGSAGVGRSESRDREDVGLRDRKATRRVSRSRRKKKKKKRCAMVRRLQEASCGAVRAIFRRLLACTTSVDVADAGAQPSSR